MKKPIIHNEDPNLEYNPYDASYLKYKGELFTGTLLYDDTNPVSYTEYTNGDYDGESVSYYKNGQLAEKTIYKNGEYITGKEWYDNGQLRYNSENGNIILDKDGIITNKGGVWFYKNGQIRIITENKVTKIYSEKGNLAILIEPSDVIVNSYPTSKITYYHKVLKEDYKNLTEHIYLHAEDNSNFRSSVCYLLNHWIVDLYVNDYKEEAIEIINKMMDDSEDRLKENPHLRIQSLEQNFLHTSKIFINRLTSGEFDSSPNNNPSRIIF